MNNTFKLGNEINLLKRYPKSKRNLKARIETKSDNVREIARKFDKEFFDGHRDYGYGGFNYNPRYWSEVVKDFQSYWKLDSKSKVLDTTIARYYGWKPKISFEKAIIETYKDLVKNYKKIKGI